MSDQRRVIMRFSISGGRHDGREWPPAGEELVLGKTEADDLVRGNMAYPHPDGYEVAAHAAPPSGPADSPPSPEPAPGAGPPEARYEAAPEPAPEPPSVAPVAYAPKQAWVDWAMAQGATEDEANMMTKAQLMEAYGDRP